MKTKIIISLAMAIASIGCNIGHLNGKYENPSGLYKSIEFKGNSSVVVTDGIIGFPFATSYERDGNIIRIRTDKSDLLLTIKDNNTIIGEGFAGGTYIKTE